MTYKATISSSNPDEILVEVPATRPDVLHECDIMEDAAIAYGFNKLPDTFPATNTVAQPLEISKLSDIVRTECAFSGWIEALPLILVNQNQNTAAMKNRSLTSFLSPLPTVFPRGEFRMVKSHRRRKQCSQDRQPQDPRVPSRPHVSPPRPPQNHPREPVPRVAHSRVRILRRGLQRPIAGTTGAQRPPRSRGLVQQIRGVRDRTRAIGQDNEDVGSAQNRVFRSQRRNRVLYQRN
jgi:tRNA synthetase B5 domain